MGELSIPAESIILCTNNHWVATTNRDLHRGDLGYVSAFVYRPGQHEPKKGIANPKCICGATWFNTSIFATKCVKWIVPPYKISPTNELEAINV